MKRGLQVLLGVLSLIPLLVASLGLLFGAGRFVSEEVITPRLRQSLPLYYGILPLAYATRLVGHSQYRKTCSSAAHCQRRYLYGRCRAARVNARGGAT